MEAYKKPCITDTRETVEQEWLHGGLGDALLDMFNEGKISSAQMEAAFRTGEIPQLLAVAATASQVSL